MIFLYDFRQTNSNILEKNNTGVELWELGAHVTELCVDSVDVLTMPPCRMRPPTGAATRVKNGCVARISPRVELGVVVMGANAVTSALSVESAVKRVIVSWLGTAFAAVNSVRVCANC